MGLVRPPAAQEWGSAYRLIRDMRRDDASTGLGSFWYEYEYDAGGNRTTKKSFDRYWNLIEQVDYTYDIDYADPTEPGSRNNRLMYYETKDASGALISTTYYYYNEVGNVTRIVTNDAGSTQHSATRFVYARNLRAVSYVMGETWDRDDPEGTYDITFAREFQYDGARQRYLNRELDPEALELGLLWTVSRVWSDYDGDGIYLDYGSGQTQLRAYEPGIGEVDDPATNPSAKYFRMNHLGTTRMKTDANGTVLSSATYTAFGERIAGTNYRYGYAGAWGYQATIDEASPPQEVFPYLHVGARYYDPSTGRFLQRDPIGIRGGANVYEYVYNLPTVGVDSTGLEVNTTAINAALKISAVGKKVACKMSGKSGSSVGGPIAPLAKALEGAPDMIRIYAACGLREKSLKDADSADDFLDRYQRGHGKLVKPGSGG